MSKFSIISNQQEVKISLEFNYINDNTWAVLEGDAAILPANEGSWSVPLQQNRVEFSDSSGRMFMYFDQVQVTYLSADHFSALNRGDTGPVGMIGNNTYEWRFEEH